jgi:outer membrane protein assembly factor BamB
VYVANLEGKITVLKAGGQWDVLAQNDLAEEISATPALANGRLYVRTREAVYCFAQSSTGVAMP